jgi:hypothetical protein
MFGFTICLVSRARRVASRSKSGAARFLALEFLEERKVLTAEVGVADPAPLFTIGDGVCFADGGDVLDAAAADIAFASESLTAEGENEAPQISNFTGQHQWDGYWQFLGTLTDDGPVEGLPVYVSFNGSLQAVAYTWTDGSFSVWIYVGNDWGMAEAVAHDGDGAVSQVASYYVYTESAPPQIQYFSGTEDQGGMWLFHGMVTDDKPVAGLSVMITFNGVHQGIAYTHSDGSFSLAFYVGEDWGMAEATAYDSDGLASNTACYYVY